MEYPKMYDHDCNRNSFSGEPAVFQSTYLYNLNTTRRRICWQMYVTYEENLKLVTINNR